jgi:ABC-2 type transport system permease protein
MKPFDIALKDLRQVLRDRRSAIFLVLMPLVFTVFMGFAFRWQGNADKRLPVGVIDLDDGTLSASLTGLLDTVGAVRLSVLARAETSKVNELVHKGRLASAVVIPEGYALRLPTDSAELLTVICESGDPDGQSALRAIEVAARRLSGAAEVARIAFAQTGKHTEVAHVAEMWREPAFLVTTEKQGAAESLETRSVATGFNQASPGMLVQFAIFGMMTTGALILLERRSRTLPRMLTQPVSRISVMSGHLLAMLAVTLLQELVLVLVGQFAFKVNYLRSPAAILLVMAVLALWVSGLGLLIGSRVRGPEQLSLWALVAMFVFSALGGAWFPLDVTGRTFSKIGHLLPSAWAMDGFQNVIMRGQGLVSVLLPCGVMAGYAALFLGLAAIGFKPE